MASEEFYNTVTTWILFVVFIVAAGLLGYFYAANQNLEHSLAMAEFERDSITQKYVNLDRKITQMDCHYYAHPNTEEAR